MQIGRISGATRIVGKSQGYFGLPIRDSIVGTNIDDSGTPCMTSAWLPDPDELDRIAKGASIHVLVLGTIHPPIQLEVGEIPSED